MPLVEILAPEGHRRMPWKNGRGELVVIDCEGGKSWQDMGVAWHFGRTAIIEEGPFSDYTGYERLQVVTKGAGLVLIAPDHEIDLRLPMHPRRYDGGTPIRTLLEKGPVEVVNLIADRGRFDIDLRVGKAGAADVLQVRSARRVCACRRGARRNRRTRLHPRRGSRTARAHRFRDQMSQCRTAKSSLARSTQGLDQASSRNDRPRAGGEVHP